jgi:hypothetical protein
VERAIELAPANLHVLQEYKKPRRVKHRLYRPDVGGAECGSLGGVPLGLRSFSEGGSPREGKTATKAMDADGRLRLCPYYFVIGGKAKLSGALATFCPPDKKIIHGMQDAALLPCRVVE